MCGMYAYAPGICVGIYKWGVCVCTVHMCVSMHGMYVYVLGGCAGISIGCMRM